MPPLTGTPRCRFLRTQLGDFNGRFPDLKFNAKNKPSQNFWWIKTIFSSLITVAGTVYELNILPF